MNRSAAALVSHRTWTKLAKQYLLHESRVSTSFVLSRNLLNSTKAQPQSFAVEAPDGASYAMMNLDTAVVHHIIDLAHDKDVVEPDAQEATKIFAVEAPDGRLDVECDENLHEVDKKIEFAAAHEDRAEIILRHEEENELRKTVRAGIYPWYTKEQ